MLYLIQHSSPLGRTHMYACTHIQVKVVFTILQRHDYKKHIIQTSTYTSFCMNIYSEQYKIKYRSSLYGSELTKKCYSMK